MAVMRMLEFGSGFDHLLASSDQKGARDVTQVRAALHWRHLGNLTEHLRPVVQTTGSRCRANGL